jgi:hypothetical protein
LLHAALLASSIAGIVTGCSSGDTGNGGGTSGSAGSAGSVNAGTAGTTTAGTSNQAGSGNLSGSGQGGNSGGQNGAGTSNGGSSSGTGGNAMGGSAMGGMSSGNGPSATDLLAKLGDCTKVAGPFNPDDGSPVEINVCQTGSALWWKADMDVDCDGIQTPPCNTDNTGQPMTSIVDAAPNGDVDPTKLPYFVIPLGEPQTEWYTALGVDLGQVGAIIYKNQVIYGIFADQAGGNFIGEASYNMCGLFIGENNCDPNMGGIDPLDVTYVVFTGETTRAKGQDIYDHAKHTQMGEAAAKAWLTQ